MTPQITVLTPTWNRRHLLPRLYQSLVEQDAPEGSFEWLVVDDGSTDGTMEWLQTLASEAPFSIRLIRQENGGKHRALNRAAPELVSPWTLIVDSDDWLLPGVMLQALTDIAEADENILAIVAPRDLAGFEQSRFRLPGRAVSYEEWRVQKQVGDTSMIIRTYLHHAFPFPEYDGEMFISEGSVWARMFRDGGVWLSNNIIVRGEYQVDGLSAHSLNLRAASPLGSLAVYDEQLKAVRGGLLRQRALVNYHRFWWHARAAGRKPKEFGFHSKLLWLLPGWLFYMRDRRVLNHGR